MIKFFKSLVRKFKVRKYEYTHWDIHALARLMDPKAWAEFDALPDVDKTTGEKKYYGAFDPIKPSFNMAVNLLKNGVYPCKENLFSHDDILKFLKERKTNSI